VDDETTEFISRPGEVAAPDGRLSAMVKDYNLWLRSGSEAEGVQVTSDGMADYEWVVIPDEWAKGFWTGTGAKWSSDSRKLALKKVDGRRVEDLPFIRFLEPGAPLSWTRFARAGDPTFQTELFVLDVESKKQVRIETGAEPDQRLELLGWRDQNTEVLFLRLNRRHTKLELMAADPRTGVSRVLVTEERSTLVIGAGHGFERDRMTMLADGKRFIWKSERDGWDHFYLYDFDGNLIRRLTRGRFPVLDVVAIDGDWFYFTGRSAERPYDAYLYRVSLDGTRFTRLTEAPGSHKIEFSPSKKYFLDTHSSLVRPPAVDLRRSDGSLIRTLCEANIDALGELRWTPPEEFVVKALDGETDLYGVVYKPFDFDGSRKYPVVEYIYNGPQMSLRAFRSPFTSQRVLRAIAQLGFIVFIVDGPGTPERGREFHEATYMRYGRFEIPEHVNVLNQLASSRPFMDLERVGILGHSHGGYLALRAMLTAPEVYEVGVALSPDVDFFHDAHFYFEPYMGFPKDNAEGYRDASNLPLAANLQGKLLMVVGTEDYGAYPGTLKMVAEFVRAGKPHDLIVLPAQPHEFSGESDDYSLKASSRYFVQHLRP
jgi:dipeptidyl aminopeptidase/acylaminoacyl peptidase